MDRKTTLIFRWNGRYYGFLKGGCVFDAGGCYVGWLDGTRVWRKDGEYVGEVHAENYVLRCRTRPHPRRRTPRAAPTPPEPLAIPVHRLPNADMSGFDDGLDWLE